VQSPDEKKAHAGAAADAAAVAPSAATGVRQAGALLFVVCAAALAFEVALVRICSAVLQYHVSFAVVSLAVLGVGVGGFVAWAATRRSAARVPVVMHWALLAIAPGILLALVVMLRLPFAAHWTFLLFLLLPPYVAVGAFQALLLRVFASRASALYAIDLLGGAVAPPPPAVIDARAARSTWRSSRLASRRCRSVVEQPERQPCLAGAAEWVWHSPVVVVVRTHALPRRRLCARPRSWWRGCCSPPRRGAEAGPELQRWDATAASMSSCGAARAAARVHRR
jgi:hypothetical protein